jgi:hypothetical protein
MFTHTFDIFSLCLTFSSRADRSTPVMSAGRLKPRAVTVMGFKSGRSGDVERVHCWEKEPGDKIGVRGEGHGQESRGSEKERGC